MYPEALGTDWSFHLFLMMWVSSCLLTFTLFLSIKVLKLPLVKMNSSMPVLPFGFQFKAHGRAEVFDLFTVFFPVAVERLFYSDNQF